MRRFTFAADQLAGGRITFDREESHHLVRVLRLRPGDTVVASSGDGVDHTVRLETLGDTATGIVIAAGARRTESRLAVTLIQGVPQGDRMETIGRAATERGVTHVVPVLTARTIVQLDAARWRERARRWQRVAKEATKQCGRSIVPEVDSPRPLAEGLEALGARDDDELALCVWEG